MRLEQDVCKLCPALFPSFNEPLLALQRPLLAQSGHCARNQEMCISAFESRLAAWRCQLIPHITLQPNGIGNAAQPPSPPHIATPCLTPLMQRPVRRTEARRSETKESIRGTTHSDT